MKTQPALEKRSSYRADIDGLRAIAVLSVVAFHYWGQYFRGGYIGVDIFFVISGYLLSQIIVSELKEGRFSLSRFYERRIRRIFPALFALLIVCTACSCYFLLPGDLVSYSQSMTAASVSASNIYFWQHTSYFFGAGADKPLLHTWSLAVEEQFYVFFPLFMLLVHRYFARHLRTVVTLTAAAFLAWSIIEVRIDQAAAFYLPFSRAWELLFGAMLTLRVFPVPRSRAWRECLAVLGCMGIGAAILAFSDSTRFPGENSILPCAAAGAIILAGQDGSPVTNRILSWKPLVFIGLISYSLYLWHWPLLVFFNELVVFPKPIHGLRTLLAVSSIAIAALSWRFVETPFRTGPHRPGKRAIYVFGAICVCAFTTCGLLLSNSSGLPGRFSASEISIARYVEYKRSFPEDFRKLFRPGCFVDPIEGLKGFDAAKCVDRDTARKQVLVFGDSQAADLAGGLTSANPNVEFLQATMGACHPVLGPGRNPECKQFLDAVFGEFIPNLSSVPVVLNAEWGPEDLEALAKTIDFLHRKGNPVIVFGPRPEYDNALPRLLVASLQFSQAGLPSRHLRDGRRLGRRLLDAEMTRLASESWHVPYISLMQMLCSQNECTEYAAPGVPLQMDQDHLTLEGSIYVARTVNIKYPHVFESK